MPLTAAEELELIELLEEEERDQSRKHHIKFIDYCWKKKADPFIVGFHTERICQEIDQAIADYRKGISTYLLISVHHRAGKSDIVSRYLGPHFLGEFPDAEVMQVTYQAALSAKFSSFGRGVFLSDKYRELYPDIELSKTSKAKDYWEIEGNTGKLFASGLTSGLTGSGWNLGILDDYCSSRKEAESKVQRDNAWDAFTNDFMTRAAPVHICIILATQWHWDDVNGRIREEMGKNPNFPSFKIVSFPARAKDYKGPGTYPGEYLFMERYSKQWYESQYATLGKYAAAALLDCDPQMRTGSILSTAGIEYHEFNDKRIPSNTAIQWAQVWDLAHTKKQREGDDPDWTSGTWLGFQEVPGDPVPHLWIKRRVRCQEGAAARDRFIRKYTELTDKFTKHGIETSIDSKDAYSYACEAMPEYGWQDIQCGGDKVVRCSPLEPIFEMPGHVHVIKGDWVDDWLDEVIKFTGDGSGHDDGIDNLTAGYVMLIGASTVNLSEDTLSALARRKRG